MSTDLLQIDEKKHIIALKVGFLLLKSPVNNKLRNIIRFLRRIMVSSNPLKINKKEMIILLLESKEPINQINIIPLIKHPLNQFLVSIS